MTQFIDTLYYFTVTIGFPSYALAIIILGIIVRILLFPLSLKQMKSMLGMSEIQPELKALQEKYANNREKLSQEMSKLYKDYEINPAAGCLPMLIQMPILYALFQAMREYNFTENASFFWIDSLNNTDQTYILPIVLALVMFITQKLAMGQNSTMQDNPSMKVMLYGMPIMMGFFSINFPSGLCLYWVTTSIFLIFQQLVMNHSRKKELEKRAIEREKRQAERAIAQEEERRQHKPSKKKTKTQLRTEHNERKKTKATYKPPSGDSTATYKRPK